MSSINLSTDDQKTCLQIAKDSIISGLENNKALAITSSDFSTGLQQQLACFVTLHLNGELRGCIGALEAYQPLINDVSEHAFAAAFRDPRFPPLQSNEFEQIEIDISVLGTPETIDFKNEHDLLNQIRPEKDGLILEHGYNRGTFLPSVWEQLPDKNDFLNHLKMKAGLASDWWDNNTKISRYETFLFK